MEERPRSQALPSELKLPARGTAKAPRASEGGRGGSPPGDWAASGSRAGELPELPHCHRVSWTRSCRNSYLSQQHTHTRTQTHTPPHPGERLFLLPRGLGEVSKSVTLVVTLFYSSQTGIEKMFPPPAPLPGKVDVSAQAPPHPGRLVLTSACWVVLAGLSGS